MSGDLIPPVLSHLTGDVWLNTVGSDGLALNLGPEEWQFTQAKSAFQVLAGLSHASRLRLFLSLDCTVLPTSTVEDGQALQVKVRQLLDLGAQGYLHYRGEPLLSTFGGESASFGGQGWEGWLRGIGHEVCHSIFHYSSNEERKRQLM